MTSTSARAWLPLAAASKNCSSRNQVGGPVGEGIVVKRQRRQSPGLDLSVQFLRKAEDHLSSQPRPLYMPIEYSALGNQLRSDRTDREAAGETGLGESGGEAGRQVAYRPSTLRSAISRFVPISLCHRRYKWPCTSRALRCLHGRCHILWRAPYLLRCLPVG
jgi:hypothetical protein